MLKLEDYKVVFTVVGLIGGLLFASPTLSMVLQLSSGERFSALWVLGPEHMAENYPFNVVAGQSYMVYVGVGNHMGSSVYYVVYVKLRNQTEALPNATAGTPSPLQPLSEYRVFLQDGKSWEAPLTFSFWNVTFSENRCSVGSLRIDGETFVVDKQAPWDVENNGFYYQLFLELWIFDAESSLIRFDSRYVILSLNMTRML